MTDLDSSTNEELADTPQAESAPANPDNHAANELKDMPQEEATTAPNDSAIDGLPSAPQAKSAAAPDVSATEALADTPQAQPSLVTPDVSTIDELLDKPAWVIDLLPHRVPADAEGQFFSVERLLLSGARGAELRRRFATVLLMLNCDYYLVVYRGENEQGKANPRPEKLEKWVVRNHEHLCVALPSEDALVVVPTHSSHMALHNPSPQLLEEVRAIASACGLFVWQA